MYLAGANAFALNMGYNNKETLNKLMKVRK